MYSKIGFLLLFTFLEISASKHNLEWWKGTEIYDIYVPSFKDSNNDGIGDLTGLTSKLSYLKNLGIRTIKLSIIFEAVELITDHEGVTNYKEINPLFGTMKDFEYLLRKADKKDIKVILDLPINHCHKSHEWFQKSRRSIKPYKDYFIWRRGNTSAVPPEPPNNWLNKHYDDAWTHDDVRNKFYYHWNEASLPDLNLRNQNVKQEIKDIIHFWLDKGVAGFNLLSAYAYVEPSISRSNQLKNRRRSLEDQPKTFLFIRKLRKIVDEYSETHSDFEKILMVEDRDDDNVTMQYFGKKESPLVHIISKRGFVYKFQETILSKEFDDLMHSTIIEIVKHGKSFEWVTEYSEIERLSNKLNHQFSELILIVVTMLPGITRIYYGQEIGMREPYDWFVDESMISKRNVHALPMQWDSSPNAGFTSYSEPYAAPNSDYWDVNVQRQQQDSLSRYHLMKNLLKLRKKETLKYGDFESFIVSERVHAFARSFNRHETYLIITNLANESYIIANLYSVFGKLPKNLYVVAASTNSVYQRGRQLDTISSLSLRPLSCIVIAFTDDEKIEAELKSI